MIKRIETPEELSKIFSVIPSKYIQWLTEGISNPKLHIWAEFDIDIIGYVVAIDGFVPPISDYFTILFDWGDSEGSIKALKEEVVRCGVKSILITVPEATDDLLKLGFVETSINMRLVV